MASTPKPRVFLSSTSMDLEEHRAAVCDALRGNFDTVCMEEFGARSNTPVDVSLAEVGKCDVLIGVYAWRYGFTPEGSSRSITEEELRTAQAAGIPCYCFLLDPTYPWPDERRETGQGAERLERLKADLRRDLVIREFTAPENLAIRVLQALLQWVEERPSTDPLRRELLKVLQRGESRWTQKLAEKTSGHLLDLDLAWASRTETTGATEPLEASALATLFADRDRLVIVGQPGSGKTVVLLRLARELRARLDFRAQPPTPVPVVLDLASWEAGDRSLEDWMVRELNRQLSTPPDQARSLITSGALLPLLDGLDEVAPEHRLGCARSIMEHLGAKGGGVVVCVRSAAYDEELRAVLALQAEVFVRELGGRQIDERLAGPGLTALRDRMREDEGLRGLARNALMLHLLAKTYQGRAASAVAGLEQNASEEQVIRDYVHEMEKRPGSRRYGLQKTRRSLRWLAGQMHRTDRFEIESLEPSWLGSGFERVLYAGLSRGLGGGVLIALPALFLGLAWPALCGLAAGAWVGVVDTLPVWRVPTRGTAGRSLALGGVRAFLIGSGVLLVSRLVSAHWSPNPTGLALFIGVAFALVFGSRPGDLSGDTRFLEKLKMGWSWKGALGGAALAMPLPVLFLWLVSLLKEFGTQPHWTLGYVLLPLGVAPIGALLGGVLAGVRGDAVKIRKKPNLGLRKIARNAVRTGGLLAGAAAALFGLYLTVFWAAGQVEGWSGLPLLLLAAVTIGVTTAFWFAGMDALQHFTLRFLLSATGRFPWRWIRFLNHAVDKGLLLQVAGGWEFLHARVRDRIAELPLPTDDDEE